MEPNGKKRERKPSRKKAESFRRQPDRSSRNVESKQFSDEMALKSLIKRRLIEVPEAGYFRFVDVVGDNNSFFNALCVCPAIKDEDPWELRTSLADFIEDSMEARRVYTEILHGSIPFESFVKRLRTNRTWWALRPPFLCA